LSCSSYRTTCKTKSHTVEEWQQTVGSSGESRDENKRDVSVVQSALLEVYVMFPSEAHQEEQAAQHTTHLILVYCRLLFYK